MPSKVKLSSRLLSDIFWRLILTQDEERGPEKAALHTRTLALEPLRELAEYNTGSINFVQSWLLYAVVRYFKFQRVAEVGTFIGRSASAIGSGMDDAGVQGEIFTCDFSNSMALPWSGAAVLRQFPKTSSTDMLQQLDGVFDFVFLDGRLTSDDLPLLDNLITADTIFGLDDFEGMEKGVANLFALARLAKLKRHFLLHPPSQALVTERGFTSYSLMAMLVPVSIFEFARQG
jgi:hypothetical protein